MYETKNKPRRGRPPKADEMQNSAHDTEIFKAAADMLHMTAAHDADKFGVTRQTLAKWMRGETPAPRSAYVQMLAEVLKVMQADVYKAIADREAEAAKLNKAIDERVNALLAAKLLDKARQADQAPPAGED